MTAGRSERGSVTVVVAAMLTVAKTAEINSRVTPTMIGLVPPKRPTKTREGGPFLSVFDHSHACIARSPHHPARSLNAVQLAQEGP